MRDSFILSPGFYPFPVIFQSQHNTACTQLLHMDGGLPLEERKGKLVLRALACGSRNNRTHDLPVLPLVGQFGSFGDISPWTYTQGEKNKIQDLL